MGEAVRSLSDSRVLAHELFELLSNLHIPSVTRVARVQARIQGLREEEFLSPLHEALGELVRDLDETASSATLIGVKHSTDALLRTGLVRRRSKEAHEAYQGLQDIALAKVRTLLEFAPDQSEQAHRARFNAVYLLSHEFRITEGALHEYARSMALGALTEVATTSLATATGEALLSEQDRQLLHYARHTIESFSLARDPVFLQQFRSLQAGLRTLVDLPLCEPQFATADCASDILRQRTRGAPSTRV